MALLFCVGGHHGAEAMRSPASATARVTLCAAPAAGASKGRLALPALLAGACVIGSAPIFVRLSEVGPTVTAFYRLLLALPLLWTWAAWEVRRGRSALPKAPAVRRLFGAGLFLP
jgi:hypothetical protein